MDIDWQGHRGARGVFPENTILGFHHALDMGMTTLELDVVISGDKQVVVSHEPYINPEICRDTTGVIFEDPKAINLYTLPYSEIVKYDCGTVPHPRFPYQQKIALSKPLLRQVIEASESYAQQKGRALPFYNIEIKSKPEEVGISQPDYAEFVDLVLKEITDAGIVRRTTLQSFDPGVLNEAHKRNLPLSYSLLVESEGALEVLLSPLEFQPDVLSPHYALVSPELVQAVHDKDMLIIPWTVNELEEARTLLQMGVDGLITDYPSLRLDCAAADDLY